MRLPLPSSLEGRIRLAGLLVGVGLCVEFATLFWLHPLSFMSFVGISAVLVCLGILVFLLAIVGEASRSPADVQGLAGRPIERRSGTEPDADVHDPAV